MCRKPWNIAKVLANQIHPGRRLPSETESGSQAPGGAQPSHSDAAANSSGGLRSWLLALRSRSEPRPSLLYARTVPVLMMLVASGCGEVQAPTYGGPQEVRYRLTLLVCSSVVGAQSTARL